MYLNHFCSMVVVSWWISAFNVVVARATLKFPKENFHSKTSTMMDAYVTYNAQYQVLICRQHQYAITPDWITRHFQDSHQGIPLATRQAIVEYSQQVDLAMPENVATPVLPVESIAGLNIIHGFQCQYEECSELCGTEGSMRKHCRRTHKWVAGVGIKWTNQCMQTIFEGNRRK